MFIFLKLYNGSGHPARAIIIVLADIKIAGEGEIFKKKQGRKWSHFKNIKVQYQKFTFATKTKKFVKVFLFEVLTEENSI